MAVDATLQSYANQAADHFNIPQPIFNSLISTESSWNTSAISSVGAVGLTQLMPATAAQIGVDPYDPAQNIAGGASYLSQMFAKFGNWTDALAAYNAGPGNIAAGQGYAQKVLAGAAANGYTPDPATTGTSASSAATPSNAAPGWFSLQNFLGLGSIDFASMATYGVAILALGVVGYFGIKMLFASAAEGEHAS